MASRRLAVLGIGSLRFGPAVSASLASYFGESDLSIVYWDVNAELLDLFERLAQVFFVIEKSKHFLESTGSLEEALTDTDLVVISWDEERGRDSQEVRVGRANNIADYSTNDLVRLAPADSEVLVLGTTNVQRPNLRSIDWPEAVPQEQSLILPHQILRWINGEEYPFDLLKEYQFSPLKHWLDNQNAEL